MITYLAIHHLCSMALGLGTVLSADAQTGSFAKTMLLAVLLLANGIASGLQLPGLYL